MMWRNRGHTNEGGRVNDTLIKVAVNRDATLHAVNEAKEASQKLNNLLEENGFTLKIFVAAGGNLKKKRVT